MNASEASALLAHAAAFDNRQPSAAASKAWAAALHDVPLDDDALAAVARFYGTADPSETGQKWIQPHHVRAHRAAIRDDRLAARPELAPPVDPANEEAYRQALKVIRNRVGDGRMPFKAISGGRHSGADPSREFRDARSAEDRDRVLAQTIACPVEHCPAQPGEPCRSGPLTAPMTRWHPSRLAAAVESEASA